METNDTPKANPSEEIFRQFQESHGQLMRAVANSLQQLREEAESRKSALSPEMQEKLVRLAKLVDKQTEN